MLEKKENKWRSKGYPWTAYSSSDTNWWWVILDKSGNEFGSQGAGFEEPDARIMALAPEMLDVLRMVGSADGLPSYVLEKVEEIIKRAETSREPDEDHIS